MCCALLDCIYSVNREWIVDRVCEMHRNGGGFKDPVTMTALHGVSRLESLGRCDPLLHASDFATAE